MGGSCTKLVTVKTPVHSNTAFHTIVQSIPPRKVDQNVDQSSIHEEDHRKLSVDNGGSNDIESQDLFSTGDHNKHEQGNENIEDKYTLTHNDMPDGDYKLEINHKNATKKHENNAAAIEIVETDVLEEESENNTTAGTNGSSRSNSATVQVDAITNGPSSESNEEFRDLNDNSGHDLEREGEGKCKQNVQKIEVRSGDGDGKDNDRISLGNEAEKLDDGTEKPTNNYLEKGDQINNGEGEGEEPELCEVQTLIQDSLFFFPLQTDKPRPVTPHKVPDRLQNRSRKPLLSYNERMLLADLNRFEQLDKRREFAVKRNRSISRNGKLPKINASKDDLAEEGSHSPNNNDEYLTN